MKSLVLSIIISLLVISEAAAFTNQTNYRWRNDDGNETNATWMTSENTPVFHEGTDPLRLRTQFINPEVITPSDFEADISLFYGITDDMESSSWTKITLDANNAFVSAASSFVSNLDPTDRRLSEYGGLTFQSGLVFTSTFDQTINLQNNYYSEYEWVIQPTANASSGIYYFKLGWGSDEFITVPSGAPAVLNYETPISPIPLRNWAVYVSVILLMGFMVFRFYKRA